MTTSWDLKVCSACVAMLANGDVGDHGDGWPGMAPDDDGAHLCNRRDDDNGDNPNTRHAALMDAQWPARDGWHLVPGDADLGFSSHPCDGCGTRLHGDRFLAHASN